jgi:holo-ACP synthase
MLKDILDAREKRVYRRKRLEALYNRPVVTFTINIPGGEKNSPKYRWLCGLAVEEYLGAMEDRENTLEFIEDRTSADGPETFLVINEEPAVLKEIGMEIEENHFLGRLFDIDVSGVSRDGLSQPLRKCIVCHRDAVDCIVGRRHTRQEVLETIDYLIESWKSIICRAGYSAGDMRI